MPLITLPYDWGKGPHIEIFVSKPKSITFREDEIAESTCKLDMLIDSGASKTAISAKMAQKIGLLSIGKTTLKSATHNVDANIFYADLRCDLFGSPVYFRDMNILEFPLADGWKDGFLGRDFLNHVKFSLDGPKKEFSLETKD